MKLGRLFSLFLFSLSVTLVSMSMQAQEVYRARLSPMPTTPQSVADITGEGEVILTLNGNALSVEGNFSGISSATTMGHIHNGPPAQPGPVIHRLEVTAALSGNISAELELTDEQVTALRNNELYVQIDSENNAPGELRGWIFLRSHFDS